MVSIISTLFNPLPNAIMTILLGVMVLYWLLTFLTGDFLGDLDFGFDPDLDIEVDQAIDSTISTEPSFFQKALSFINVGKVPIMLVISMFKFISWIMTIASSMLFNVASWGAKSALILIPIFIIAYFITRWATKPFIAIYREMGYNGEQSHDLIGRSAILKSNVMDNAIGNAELTVQSDVIKILVRSKDGQKIAFNSAVILLEESDDKTFYWIQEDINLTNVLNDK